MSKNKRIKVGADMTAQTKRAVNATISTQASYIKQQKGQIKSLNALIASDRKGTVAIAQIEDIKRKMIRAGIIDENNNLTSPYTRNER